MVKIGPRSSRRRSTPQSIPPSIPPKRALLIGINYTGADKDSDYGPLHRAQDDAKEFKDLLISRYEYQPGNIVLMLDSESVAPSLRPTRANILREIGELVKDAQDGSRFVFFYSGHSGQVESPDRQEEDDGFDEFIVPVDHDKIRVNLTQDENGNVPHREEVKKRMIIDNKLRKMLVDALPIGAHLTAIFDSCHSGTLLDLDHYLCNNVYNPRMMTGYRRYKTMWQNVRRKDGQRMSEAGVKVITKKQRHPDSRERISAPSSPLSKEGSSSCSVRIYQRKRVSENEMEVTNTSVGVIDIDGGKKRQFSVESRRASVQVRRSLSIAQVIENSALGLSIDSLVDDGAGLLDMERCASPDSYRLCNGFCEPEPGGSSARSATVMSISSCQDAQLTWESKKGSFTQWLISILRREPHQPIGSFLRELTDKMHEHAQRKNEWSQKRKESWRRKHNGGMPSEDSNTLAGSDHGESAGVRPEAQYAEQYLDGLDFGNVPAPQLGAQARVDLNQPMDL
ncbi:peptidase C14 [Dichomitus squalens]|nr:peptidase C14 [Dichomitus squalens]